MLIPLRTNRMLRRRPIVTEALIVLNMLVFLLGLVAEYGGTFDREALVSFGHLWRLDFHFWQPITYQFLHDPGSIWHLAFNMLFLWVFGCGLEDRLGRLSFLMFYLMGGIISGVAHMMFSAAPVIGASGAIAAVTGAFLAMFPRSRIKVLFFFFFIRLFDMPALFLIGFFIFLDILRQTMGLLGGPADHVAYMAHIAGYAFGFTLAFSLLGLGIVKREEFDAFFLIKQAQRRAAFRRTSRYQVGGQWESASADTAKQAARAKKRAEKCAPEIDAEMQWRAEISQLLADHDIPAAAKRYRELLARNPLAVFTERQQIDLANQFQADEDYEGAAIAYELLIKHYPACSGAGEMRLMLALLYVRRLDRGADAGELLARAIGQLADRGQLALAKALLQEIGGTP